MKTLLNVIGIASESTLTANTINIIENTVYNCGDGSSANGIAVNGDTISEHMSKVINNISVANSSFDYVLNNVTHSGYNIHSDYSIGGTGSIYVSPSQVPTLFVSVTQGSEDLHLASNSPAVDSGKGISRYYNDIDGDSTFGNRGDIGADEFVAGKSLIIKR